MAFGYSDGLDSAPPQPREVPVSLANESLVKFRDLCAIEIDELWLAAEAGSVDLSREEFAAILLGAGAKCNYGAATETTPAGPQIAQFFRSLPLQDLAVAQACALGREAAWQRFIARFRQPLIESAIAITGSAARGQELADSFYAELYGLSESGEKRRSPLVYYSGRGSLRGFLRMSLAQRHVDHHRRFHREVPMPDRDLPAAPTARPPEIEILSRLHKSLTVSLQALEAEEKFLLAAWFLDRRTLLEISRILRVHEATVSRRLQRLTARLHQAVLRELQSSGLSRAAAEEALRTDPRDLDLNLQALLQASRPDSFYQQEDKKPS